MLYLLYPMQCMTLSKLLLLVNTDDQQFDDFESSDLANDNTQVQPQQTVMANKIRYTIHLSPVRTVWTSKVHNTAQNIADKILYCPFSMIITAQWATIPSGREGSILLVNQNVNARYVYDSSQWVKHMLSCAKTEHKRLNTCRSVALHACL